MIAATSTRVCRCPQVQTGVPILRLKRSRWFPLSSFSARTRYSCCCCCCCLQGGCVLFRGGRILGGGGLAMTSRVGSLRKGVSRAAPAAATCLPDGGFVPSIRALSSYRYITSAHRTYERAQETARLLILSLAQAKNRVCKGTGTFFFIFRPLVSALTVACRAAEDFPQVSMPELLRKSKKRKKRKKRKRVPTARRKGEKQRARWGWPL